MNFVKLIKKTFGLRSGVGANAPLIMFAGRGVVLATDKRFAVYVLNPAVTHDVAQVAVPVDLNDVDAYDPELGSFMDPDGEAVTGSLVMTDEEAEKAKKVVDDMITALMESVTPCDASLKTLFLSGKPFYVRNDPDSDGSFVRAVSNKKEKLIPGFKKGEAFDRYSDDGKTLLPLNSFKKDKPEVGWCAPMRSASLFFTTGACGALVPLSFKNKPVEQTEKESDMPKTNAAAEKLNSIINGAAKPAVLPPTGITLDPSEAPRGAVIAKTPNADPAFNADPMESMDEVSINQPDRPNGPKPSTRKSPTEPLTGITVDPSEAPDTLESVKAEVVEDSAKAAELLKAEDAKHEEEPAPDTNKAVPETDESRHDSMMALFRDGMVSEIRDRVTFLERLVKLQARLIKKGSTSAASKKALEDVRRERDELKRENVKLTAARKKIMDAMGISV